MADYSGAYEPSRYGNSEDTNKSVFNQTIAWPNRQDLDVAIKEVLDRIRQEESSDESTKEDGDPRNDYSRGFDAGWAEGYEAAQHEAVVAVVKAIINL